MRKFLVPLIALAVAFFSVSGISSAAEVPKCTGSFTQKTIYSGQAAIENLIVGGGGVLYTSTTDGTNSLLNAYTKGVAAPRAITTGLPGGGGLAWNGKRLLWGYGDTLANGIARGKDGFVYASNNLGLKLDRISPEGETVNGWASLNSANGLSVGKNGRYLYANQMFTTPSTIAKIDTTDPSKVTTFFTSPETANVLLDGLTRDGENNLYAAVYGKGEVWKVSPSKEACVIATGLSQTTSVAISGAKKGFRAGNLYAAGFDGKIVQVTGATEAGFPG